MFVVVDRRCCGLLAFTKILNFLSRGGGSKYRSERPPPRNKVGWFWDFEIWWVERTMLSTFVLSIIFSAKEGEGGGVWCCCGGSKVLTGFSFTKILDPFATVRCLCVIEGRCVWAGGEYWLKSKGILFSVKVGVGSVIPISSGVEKSGFGSNGVFWMQKLVTVLFSISFSCEVVVGLMLKF
uniref:Uncharacterized protein n=1 Tax=Meloidogyne enterolobii TaxID=390850 RepID=A0A6V7X1E9_MELEN|nr:unnamed protein product [Meloidogyne enterolobii]